MRIGINGFGRIGRAIARIAFDAPDIEVVVVNELDKDLENFAYLLAFDTVYGRYHKPVSVRNDKLDVAGSEIAVFNEARITDVPWSDYKIDVLIEATGVATNVIDCRKVLGSAYPRKVVVTNANKNVDTTVLIGANCDQYDPDAHDVVSSSICDANAVLPVLKLLDEKWGIESAFLTTLHPLLAYQNVTDGPLSSISNPGHTWTDYSLGRATYGNLIPKDTTAGNACLTVLPNLDGKLDALSFRVPTIIVSASDFSVNVGRPITVEAFHEAVADLAAAFPRSVMLENRPLVSSDYTGVEQSCIVDQRRTKVVGDRFIKIVSWYDNEWGYSSRVLDVARLVAS